MANHPARKPKRLYERRQQLMKLLVKEYRDAHDYGPEGGIRVKE
jgi:hypothetical protein